MIAYWKKAHPQIYLILWFVHSYKKMFYVEPLKVPSGG